MFPAIGNLQPHAGSAYVEKQCFKDIACWSPWVLLYRSSTNKRAARAVEVFLSTQSIVKLSLNLGS